MRRLRLALLAAACCSTAPEAAQSPGCALAGRWYRARWSDQRHNFSVVAAGHGSYFRLPCVEGRRGDMACTGDANLTLAPLAPGSVAVKLGWAWNATLSSSSSSSDPGQPWGFVDANCSFINFVADGTEAGTQFASGLFGDGWCAAASRCSPPPYPPSFAPHSDVARFWSSAGAAVHLIQVSHSDIFFLGAGNDVRTSVLEIAAALDIMNYQDAHGLTPRLRWNHECVLFVRAFVEFFPEREAELVRRMVGGQFDIGATFTEPFEQTLYNEILIRQLYEGRKWFTERYPEVDSARVAFQQDSPAKALQMPQVYNKSGVRYFKGSRFGNAIFDWAAPDGSSVLAFEQYDYAQADSVGNSPYFSSDTVFRAMQRWQPQFAAAHAPPLLPVALGHDYRMPTLFDAPLNGLPGRAKKAFMNEWTNVSGPAVFGAQAPRAVYSTVHSYLQQLDASRAAAGGGGFTPRILRGERPNLWYAETTWTHHWLFQAQRAAARTLPAAEAFASFRAMVERSWDSYPDEMLGSAWLNLTLADHGIGEQATPYDMPCRGPDEQNTSQPWTPFLCTLVRPNSPKLADAVYALKWGSARRAADEMLQTSQSWLADRVETPTAPPVGTPGRVTKQRSLVVFNQLSWDRDDVVTVDVSGIMRGLDADDSQVELVVRDGNGSVVPSQRCCMPTQQADAVGHRVHDPRRETADENCTAATSSWLVFIARAVPSLGYTSFSVTAAPAPNLDDISSSTQAQPPGGGEPTLPPASASQVGQPWSRPFENQYFIVEPGRGGLAQVVDKTCNCSLFNTSKLMAGEWASLSYTATGASETHSYRHPSFTGGAGNEGSAGFNSTTMASERLGNHSGWIGWRWKEAGPVRTVFESVPVQTRCSEVSYMATVYHALKRIDYTTQLRNWRNCDGVSNRLSFPIRTATTASAGATDSSSQRERNVTFATNFGTVTVGIDEIDTLESNWSEPGKLDTWLTDPGPADAGSPTGGFDRGWAMGPRECLDWAQAEADGASVMLGSGVGLVDWTDRLDLYDRDQVVLAPELLLHTVGNAGPFTNETGDHEFSFSLFSTAPGWRSGWRLGVGSQAPLTSVWQSSTAAAGSSSSSSSSKQQLPQRGSFLSTGDGTDNLWVTTVKREQPMQAPWQECPPNASFVCAPRKSGAIVRVFDNEGRKTAATLRLMVPINGTARTDMIEQRPVEQLQQAADTDEFEAMIEVAPHSIETFRLDLGMN